MTGGLAYEHNMCGYICTNANFTGQHFFKCHFDDDTQLNGANLNEAQFISCMANGKPLTCEWLSKKGVLNLSAQQIHDSYAGAPKHPKNEGEGFGFFNNAPRPTIENMKDGDCTYVGSICLYISADRKIWIDPMQTMSYTRVWTVGGVFVVKRAGKYEMDTATIREKDDLRYIDKIDLEDYLSCIPYDRLTLVSTPEKLPEHLYKRYEVRDLKIGDVGYMLPERLKQDNGMVYIAHKTSLQHQRGQTTTQCVKRTPEGFVTYPCYYGESRGIPVLVTKGLLNEIPLHDMQQYLKQREEQTRLEMETLNQHKSCCTVS